MRGQPTLRRVPSAYRFAFSAARRRRPRSRSAARPCSTRFRMVDTSVGTSVGAQSAPDGWCAGSSPLRRRSARRQAAASAGGDGLQGGLAAPSGRGMPGCPAARPSSPGSSVMARPLPRSNHCRTGIWRLTEILEPSSLSVYTLIRWPLRRPRHCKTLGILTVNLYYVTALSPDNEDIRPRFITLWRAA